MVSYKQPKADKCEKNVALGGAQTHTSHSLERHPNHLDHQLYMLLSVFNSQLRAYWSWSRTLTFCALPSAVTHFSASAHHLLEDICTFANGIPSFKLNVSQLFYFIKKIICFLINNLKQTNVKRIVLLSYSRHLLLLKAYFLPIKNNNMYCLLQTNFYPKVFHFIKLTSISHLFHHKPLVSQQGHLQYFPLLCPL